METSIQQIVTEFTQKMCDSTYLITEENLDQFADKAFNDAKAFAKRLAEERVKLLNETIREAKAWRREQGFVMQEHDRDRMVITKLGDTDVTRDYYKDKKTGNCFYPVDELIGIRKRQRITESVVAEIVTNSTESSFAKSVERVDAGYISRQTVRNKILETPSLEIKPKRADKTAKDLHVFADEDHVHMQKPNKAKGKRNQQIPIVTVTEGIDKSKARHETMDPVHFVDEDFDTKKLWNDVDAFINEKYDTGKINNIYLHADGGRWIKNGLENYPNVVSVMDEFHIEKALRTLGHIDFKRTCKLRSAIKPNNILSAKETFNEMLLEFDPGDKEYKTVARLAKYILGNWESIVRRKTLKIPGSCTESIVSHKLSKRFSRNPQGWSKRTLGKLTKLRIYVENGGEITPDIYREGIPKTQHKEALKRLLDGEDEAKDFSLFESKRPIFDWQSGTQLAIRKLGQMRSI